MKASDASAPLSWTVGQLAQRVGVATHVLRHWEDEGLLAPARDASGYRRYGRDDLVRVMTILSSRVAGMSLEQVRALLDVDSATRHQVLSDHLARLEEQRRELERSRLMTEHALRCQAHDVARCPRFAAHVEELVEGAVRGGGAGAVPGLRHGLPGHEPAVRPRPPGGRRSG